MNKTYIIERGSTSFYDIAHVSRLILPVVLL